MPLDAIVVGSGPNGLTAAATLARRGLRTLVLEAQASPGGAAASRELTERGFLHDVGAAFFPFGPVSPGFRALDLEGAGLSWCHAPIDSAHIDASGRCAVLARDLERTGRELGVDGAAAIGLARWRERMGDRFVRLSLDPLPLLDVLPRLGLPSLARFAEITLSSSGGYGRRHFETEMAQRMVADLCLHADLGPDDPCGAVLGTVLALLALTAGFPVAKGGAGAITRALAQRFAEAGGSLQLSSRVERILIRARRVVGVRLDDGTEIEAPLVLADVPAPKLVFSLVGPEHLPPRLVSALRTAEPGWGTFKVDWALDGQVPWKAASAREANVVHLGGSLDDLAQFTDEVRRARLPSKPWLLLGQQSLSDPSRAPAGKHVLYAYTHVPSSPEAGAWSHLSLPFVEVLEDSIEAAAPGFRNLIRARQHSSPTDLEAMNENLVGGDLGGGTSQIDNLLFFRPAFPYFRYNMGVPGLYLCSSFAHPGGGVHGACGYNAARVALGLA